MRHRFGSQRFSFTGSDVVGERAAAMYTIVQTTKLTRCKPGGPSTRHPCQDRGQAPINRIEEMPWERHALRLDHSDGNLSRRPMCIRCVGAGFLRRSPFT